MINVRAYGSCPDAVGEAKLMGCYIAVTFVPLAEAPFEAGRGPTLAEMPPKTKSVTATQPSYHKPDYSCT